jgi:hypothetical protein
MAAHRRKRLKKVERRLHYLRGNSACRRETVWRFGSLEASSS